MFPRRPPFPTPRPPQPLAEDPPPLPATPPLSRAPVEGQVRRPAPAIVPESLPDGFSDRVLSRSNSTGSVVSSITSVGGRARNVTLKSKTSYQLAHPPPAVHRPRLGVRPKLLLQLQRLSGAARPIPALDVLPSTVFAPRLARSLPRFFTGKDGFHPGDILVMTSEDYASSSPSGRGEISESMEDDNLGARQLVAAICQVRKGEGSGRGKAEICLGSGPTWEAMPLLNGGYELTSKDTDGSTTTVRWVQRKPANRRRSSTFQGSTSVRSDDEKRFVFSIISPDTRRHPIVASMNRNTIDISDHYSTSSPSPSVYTPTPPMGSPSAESAHTSFFELHERTLIRTSEFLKTLILASGIWVAFREGWSQNFKYNDASASPANTLPGPSNAPRASRCSSMPLSVLENSREPKADELGNNHQDSPQSTSGRFLRSGGQLLHRSTAPQASSATTAPESNVSCPRRANSTGTAFRQRGHNRTGSRIREIGDTLSSTPLGGSEGESESSPPSPSIPARQQPISAPTDVNGYIVPPILAAGHGSRTRRRVQSAYYPKATESAGEGCAVGNTLRGEEGEKKRWSRLKNLFSIVRRTSGVPIPQR
ncbi:MAG: hypothetical protein M1839_006554 [Geoglossum umbratile]|nr:MAG: hypothetical protein M1839_006554 [Geoglossum umbratile]